ncbi:hypothetical protein HDU91_003197 [Kappamyces sp. JEL0680]|nr:hypothetical protein HDU91_003197 [Kappamyces sp. JEL0680]
MTTRKTVIVTGSSKGIGQAVATILQSQGHQVFGCGTSAGPSQPPSSRFGYLATDLSVPGNATKVVEACMAQFGRVDALVHNAGVIEPIAPVAQLDVAAFQKLFHINVLSGVELFQAAVEQLRQNHGSVVLVSSGAATQGYSGWAAYGASKAALNIIAGSLAKEEPDITSVSIRPGVVDTAMQTLIRQEGKKGMADAFHRRFVDLHADDKLLRPEQPAAAIARLAVSPIRELSGTFIDWQNVPLEETK